MTLSRRGFLVAAPGAAGMFAAAPLALGAPRAGSGPAGETDGEPTTMWPEFPRHPAERAREMVGVCHRDIDRGRALLDEHPSLVNATWDWGFGDFETALGAAAHTGRRNIAELLLERGARLDIYAAAMLGQTETVKSMIAAAPGIQRNPGPHGITLLAHARAGGEAAEATLAFLEGLGDADTKPPTAPLGDEEKQALCGRYEGAGVTAETTVNRNGDIVIAINGNSAIVLRHAGDRVFFPSGAPAVRVVFSGEARELSIVDRVPVMKAMRVS